MMSDQIVNSSFKDPSGFVFTYNGEFYRYIDHSYSEHYNYLIASGLYNKLISEGLLTPFEEISPKKIGFFPNAFKILRPYQILFITYPYEWSFDMLKDAALCTLKIQSLALQHDMILKDASAYNIQFYHGKPILIDILSFEKWDHSSPWKAYGQFCRHFLSPLAIGAYVDFRLVKLLLSNLDGLPLDMTSCLLPIKTKLKLSILIHIHLHAKKIRDISTINYKNIVMPKKRILAIIDDLSFTIESLHLKKQKTFWSEYNQFCNYSEEALKEKKQQIKKWLDELSKNQLVDIGANLGEFSRIGAYAGYNTISLEQDHTAINMNYLQMKQNKLTNLLPCWVDFTNLSPSLGWENEERLPLIKRLGHDNTVLCLAMLHHLVIGNNIPLSKVIYFLSKLASQLIIEFVPKSDSQVKTMLLNRDDIFKDYTFESLYKYLDTYFTVIKTQKITNSERYLICCKRKS